MERLEGCDIGGAATVGKGMCLEPGQVCLYRYTDVARAARASWFDTFARLQDMSHEHPGPARRLGTMLHEADGYVAGVRGGGGLQNRLGCIHHLLLVTAQAHSLHHNYQMRHTVNEANGKALMGALDRLTDALSETSAALLGLVPQVAVTSPPTLTSNTLDRALIAEERVQEERKRRLPLSSSAKMQKTKRKKRRAWRTAREIRRVLLPLRSPIPDRAVSAM